MSRRYETVATVEISGDEIDLPVRAFVELEPSRSRGWTATLDGEVELKIDGAWVPESAVDGLSLGRVEESLCDLALEDDTDQCVDHDTEEDY